MVVVVALTTNTIASNGSNADLSIQPSGTGDVLISALRINGTTLEIHGGKKGDKSISKIEVEKEYIVDGLKGLPAGWRVEEDFINSIVKGAPVIHSPFDVGVQYMEFTDAVSISAQEGKVVHLPFRN